MHLKPRPNLGKLLIFGFLKNILTAKVWVFNISDKHILELDSFFFCDWGIW